MGRQRFTVGFGEPAGQRWWPWRFVVHGSNVYAMRIDPAFSKISLHADGNWQFSNTQEHWAGTGRPNQERHIERWTRPLSDAMGHCLAVRLFFAEQFTLPAVESKLESSEIDHWIPLRDREGVHICLVLSEPNAAPLDLVVHNGPHKLPATALWQARLANGETLSVLTAAGPLAKPVDYYFIQRRTSRIARRGGNRIGHYRGTICIGGSPAHSFIEAYWQVL